VTTSRRAVLALLSAVALAACTADDDAPRGDGATSLPGTRSGTPFRTPGRPPEPAPTLPAVPRWSPPPGEPHLEIKQAAADALQAAGTWAVVGGGTPRTVAGRLPGVQAATFAALMDGRAAAATLDVEYPQMGGLITDQASVITVVRQRLATTGEDPTGRVLVLDVRLVRGADGSWAVTGVQPTAPLVPAQETPMLTTAAQRVLDHPRLDLPAPAEADVRTGRIDDGVLTVTAGLAEGYDLQVQVFYDGHPVNVFGTDRVSRHTQGRAVDITAIDGRLVADPGMPHELLQAVMTRAGELGATEVGGPFDLNGKQRGYFTDAVHLDHLHIAVSRGVAPAVP